MENRKVPNTSRHSRLPVLKSNEDVLVLHQKMINELRSHVERLYSIVSLQSKQIEELKKIE